MCHHNHPRSVMFVCKLIYQIMKHCNDPDALVFVLNRRLREIDSMAQIMSMSHGYPDEKEEYTKQEQ